MYIGFPSLHFYGRLNGVHMCCADERAWTALPDLCFAVWMQPDFKSSSVLAGALGELLNAFSPSTLALPVLVIDCGTQLCRLEHVAY